MNAYVPVEPLIFSRRTILIRNTWYRIPPSTTKTRHPANDTENIRSTVEFPRDYSRRILRDHTYSNLSDSGTITGWSYVYIAKISGVTIWRDRFCHHLYFHKQRYWALSVTPRFHGWHQNDSKNLVNALLRLSLSNSELYWWQYFRHNKGGPWNVYLWGLFAP